MKKRTITVLLAIALIALGCASISDAASDKRVQTNGVLTSIESDGSVLINEKGYEVDPSARVLDGMGRVTTLDKFTLPAKVYFEFLSTQRGVVIRLIREIPQ